MVTIRRGMTLLAVTMGMLTMAACAAPRVGVADLDTLSAQTPDEVVTSPLSAEALAAFQRGYEAVRPLIDAERAALPRLGEAAALRFTVTRLHDRIFHDPSNLVTPKDPAVFLRRMDHWRAAETV